MGKGAAVLLALVLLALLATGSADAWTRSKMYDGILPYDAKTPNLGMPGWNTEIKNAEIRAGDLIGGRWCMRTTCAAPPQGQDWDSKAKMRTDGSQGWPVVSNLVTSVYWDLNILGDANPAEASNRCPQIYIRLGSGGAGLPGGQVKVAYDARTEDGSNTRGWYCQTGTRTGGGIDLGGGRMGLPVEPGIWHKIRLTVDPVAGTWDLWVNDGNSDNAHMSGTVAADTSSTRYIQWGKIDSDNKAKIFYTDSIYWGQGENEISPIGQAGVSDPVVTLGPDGTSATITYTTDSPSNTRVVWDKDFYTWGNDDTVSESVTDHSYTISGLEPRTTYTFYCESTDGVTTRYAPIKQFRTADEPTPTLSNSGFEQGNDIWPWVDCVPPQGTDNQRWGGSFYNYCGSPFAGKMWSGSRSTGYDGRDWACIRQQVSVTPGKAYKATVRFYDNFDPGADPWAFTDAMGRIGLDPTGGTDPGTIIGSGVFQENPSVYFGNWVYRPAVSASWQQASALCVAESDVMTVFLQHHYRKHPDVWLQFDEADIQEGPMPPTTCVDTKTWTPGYQVNLKGVVVTSRREAGDYTITGYVQDSSERAGIRVTCINSPEIVWPMNLDVGATVDVTGILAINKNKELEVCAHSIRQSGTTAEGITARGLSNKDAGGGPHGLQAGVENGVGANNIGLLVTVWGKVTGIGPQNEDGDWSVFIDDGSGLIAGEDGSTTTYPGIEVVIPWEVQMDSSQFVPGRTYVSATGPSSMKAWDPDDTGPAAPVLKRIIVIRTADDVQFAIP